MTQSPETLPDRLRDVEHLEEVMTTPSAALVAALENLPGDIIVLGVGGKIGPSLAQLAKRAAPLRQRNVLQLANTLPRNAEIFADVLQSLWCSPVEPETPGDDFLFPSVEHVEQPVHFMEQVFVAQQFERRLRLFVSYSFGKLR